MKNQLSIEISRISDFLGRKPVSDSIPDRNTIAGFDGRWVKTSSDWRSSFTDEQLTMFNQINAEGLKRAGYKI